MKLPKELTTVTPLSKITAIVVLVGTTLIGFSFGIIYKETTDYAKEQETNVPQIAVRKERIDTIDETSDWKTYTNTTWKYKVSYPPQWKLLELNGGQINLASQEKTQYGSSKFYIELSGSNRNRNFTNLEEEARSLGEEQGQCTDLSNNGAPGGACPPLPPKTISKRLLTDGNEYYLVVTATGKKVAIIPIANYDKLLEIKSVIWPTDSKELFEKILSTFQFTNP